MTTTVLEICRVPPPPPPGVAAELSVPLSFFDLIWLHFCTMRRLFFYDYPCSKSHFLDTLVPQLKHSLSLTLKHYLPLAGNLLYPSHPDQKMPLFRYVVGDSVSLTIAESSCDFDELVGNHARDADQFYDFVAQMPPLKDEPEYKIVPLIALKVTLFPGRGICLSYAYHHSVGDASSIASFMLAWASINKFGGDDHEEFQSKQSLPIFDRCVIQDTHGTDNLFWKVLGKIPFKPQSSFPIPTNRLILTQGDITKLKDMVLAKKPSLVQVSSFVVTASYVWSRLVKSGDAAWEEVGENESEILILAADARGRLSCQINPPVPANYFGNCLGVGLPIIEHKKLWGKRDL